MNNCNDEIRHTCGELIRGKCITVDNTHLTSEILCPNTENTTQELYEKLSDIKEAIDTTTIQSNSCIKIKKKLPLKEFFEMLITNVDLLACEDCPTYKCKDLNLTPFKLKISCQDECEPSFTKLSEVLQYLIDKYCDNYGCLVDLEVEIVDSTFFLDFDNYFQEITTTPLDNNYEVRIEVTDTEDNILEVLNGNYGELLSTYSSNISNPLSIKSFANGTVGNTNSIWFTKQDWAYANNYVNHNSKEITWTFTLKDPSTDEICRYKAVFIEVEVLPEYKTYNSFSELLQTDQGILFYKWASSPNTSEILNILGTDNYTFLRGNPPLPSSLLNNNSLATIINVEQIGNIDRLIYSTTQNTATTCNNTVPNTISVRQGSWTGSSYTLSTLMSNFLPSPISNNFPSTRVQIAKILKDPIRTHNGEPILWLGGADCNQNPSHQLLMMYYTKRVILTVSPISTSGDGEIVITDGIITENYPIEFIQNAEYTANYFVIKNSSKILNDWGLTIRRIGTQIFINGDSIATVNISYVQDNTDLQVGVSSIFDVWDYINFSKATFYRQSQFPFRRVFQVPDGFGSSNIRLFSDYPFVDNQLQVDIINFSGTSGTAYLVINSSTYTLTFNTNISTTISDFITANAATILSSHGITISTLFGEELNCSYTATTYPSISVNPISGNLTGVIVARNLQGIQYTMTFNTDKTTTISDFITANAATILSNHGIEVNQIGTDMVEFFSPDTARIVITVGSLTQIGRTQGNSGRYIPQHILDGNIYINVTTNINAGGKNVNLLKQTQGVKTNFQDYSKPTNWEDMELITGDDSAGGTTDGNDVSARFGDAGQLVILTEDSTRIIDALMEDNRNHSIRRIQWNGTNYVISTFAGLSGTSGYLDAIGTNARFNSPRGLVRIGNWVYTHDVNNNYIRRINIITQEVQTFSGSGDDNFNLSIKY